jgi:Holliday junction resolvase
VAATPERKVKDKVKALLASEGVYFFMPATHGFGRSGVPDIVACVNGFFLAIETKAGGNKPTALQIREIETIRRNNGVAVVVDETNWDMVRDLIKKLRGATIISQASEARA